MLHISRNNSRYFLSKVPTTEISPTPVQTELMQLPVTLQPEWTSQSWKDFFSTFWARFSQVNTQILRHRYQDIHWFLFQIQYNRATLSFEILSDSFWQANADQSSTPKFKVDNDIKHDLKSWPKDTHLYITLPILQRIHSVWWPSCHEHDTIMLWAASSLCCFEFLCMAIRYCCKPHTVPFNAPTLP